MKIPESVKIGGLTYKIVHTDRPNKGDIEVEGEIYYDAGEIDIRINGQASNDFKEYVFLHEIVHGIFYSMGLDQSDEDKVDRFAKGLHAFIKDNPGIFKSK